jgi:hypothetical protein
VEQHSRATARRIAPNSLLIGLIQQESVSELAPKLNLWHDRTMMVATDRMGEERSRIVAGATTNSLSPTTSHQLGSLCFVNLGSVVIAIDTLHATDPIKARRHQRSQVLWPENYKKVLSDNSNGARYSIGRVRPTRRWKQRLNVPINRKISGVAVSANGVTYLKGNHLACVDPLTGDELWSRQDIRANSKLWGDDEYVLVTEDAVSARVFQLIDGRELPSKDGSESSVVSVPSSDRRWTTIGRNILTWTDNGEVRTLRLFDPIREKYVWQQDFQYDTIFSAGCVVDNKFACILEKSGRCAIVDLQSGVIIGEDKFELPDRVPAEIKLVVSEEQFIVMVSFLPIADKEFSFLSPTKDSQICDGIIRSINRRTGKSQWQSSAFVERFALLADQPEGVPVLLFAREIKDKSSTRVLPRCEVFCIDKRDGRALFQLERQPSSRTGYRIKRGPDQSVTFELPNNKSYRLQFTDRPLAPAPPATIALEGMDSTDDGAALDDDPFDLN